MEVASPLAFAPATAGTKRMCSPPLAQMELEEPAFKRRRFARGNSPDLLSEKLSVQSPFLSVSKSIFNANGTSPAVHFGIDMLHRSRSFLVLTPAVTGSLKRLRPGERSSPQQKDLSKQVEEQATQIDSLKKENTALKTAFASLKASHEKTIEENKLLRRAVTIQQDRQSQAESELKAAHAYRDDAEDKMKKLEGMIMTLRYHLQAQVQVGNDFLHNRPPDVF